MKIAIVIPVYNAEPFLAKTLDSVRAQTYADWELILVDDGSTDGTSAVARHYAAQDSRIRVIGQARGGVSAARNRGLSEIGPDVPFVAFLDGDDLWKPQALETLLSALEAHPDAVGAHALGHYIDGSGQPIWPGEMEHLSLDRRCMDGTRVVPWPPEKPTTFSSLIVEDWIFIGALLVRQAALRAAGLFDPDLVLCEDWDLWLRLSRQGDLVFVPQTVLACRKHDQNASRHARAMERWARRVRRKTADSPLNSPEQRLIIQTAICVHHAREVAQKIRFARAEFRQRHVWRGLQQWGYVPGHLAHYGREWLRLAALAPRADLIRLLLHGMFDAWKQPERIAGERAPLSIP